MIDFIQYFINGVIVGLLYSLIALSFIVIYRSGGILNMAQGEVVVLGGFVVWTFISYASISVWIALPLAFIAVLLIGFLVERIIFRKMVGQNPFSLIMLTVGLMVLIRGVMLITWGAQEKAFPAIFPIEAIKIEPFIFTRSLFIGAIISLGLFTLVHWIFKKTRSGLKLTVVAEDHKVAQSMGISVKRSIAVAWGLGFLLSTVASLILLSGQSINFLVSDIGFRALPVALLAGLESIWGAALAGVIIGVGETLAAAYLDEYSYNVMSEAFPFLIMIIVLLIRPQGLFGWKIIQRI